MNAGEREGLRDVLAVHRDVTIRRGKADRRGVALNERVCSCGEVLPWDIGAMEVAHAAHLEAAVLDWLRARLASDEVREAVAVSLLTEHMDGDFLVSAGRSIGSEGSDVSINAARPSEVAWWATDAALTAVLAALEVER